MILPLTKYCATASAGLVRRLGQFGDETPPLMATMQEKRTDASLVAAFFNGYFADPRRPGAKQQGIHRWLDIEGAYRKRPITAIQETVRF